MFVCMPVGNRSGWGVCGKYLVQELARLTSVRFVNESGALTPELVGDPETCLELSRLEVAPESLPAPAPEVPLPVPVLKSIDNRWFRPRTPGLRGQPTAGYVFFEHSQLSDEQLESLRTEYDRVLTGCSWNERVLRRHGLSDVTTVLQGIDPRVFFPDPAGAVPDPDWFTVFSGGKLELRKGQDIVIRAFAVLQQRHADVRLVAAWHNAWPESVATLVGSRHLPSPIPTGTSEEVGWRLLADQGVDMRRVQVLGAQPHAAMADLYRQTDIGLFPSRCEGGTNLVMMEYMACGRPVIATYSSGHQDIVDGRNALILQNLQPVRIALGDWRLSGWDEPDLEEAVEQLEYAYQHREVLKILGEQAGQDLAKRTWQQTARDFLEALR